MQEVLTGNGRTALLLALGLLALPARSIEFGEVEMLSPLGEKLDARIPVKTRAGEWFHVTCITLAPAVPGAALPAVPGGTLSVERRRDSANLRLRSTELVNDPALAFSITSTCAGASAPVVAREFSILLDPPEAFARQQARARPTPPPPAPRSTAPVAPIAPRSTTTATSATPKPAPIAAPSPPPVVPRARETPPPMTAPPAIARPTPAPQAAAPAAQGEFVLKLSAVPMDLERSRQFDDKSRALLRERLRLLDSDDQVAAMLSMRDNLRRLEARVAELQLKLATTSALAESQARVQSAKPPPVPAPVVPATAAPSNVEPSPPKLDAPPKVDAPAKIEATPKAETPAPKTEAAPAPKTEVAPPPKAAPAPQASPRATESGTDFLSSLPGGPIAWAVGLGVLLLVLLLAAILRRRRAEPTLQEFVDEPDPMATTIMPHAESLERAPPEAALESEQPFELAAPLRPELSSDAGLATRLEEDTETLRRRYMEERFPEIRDRTIVLDDPSSVVKGARLFYEDGAIPRAVELLRFAIEDRPGEMRPWLALFEIYRLERLAGEYAELASRFQERHGGTEQWAKVRALGHDLDPANPLYQEPAANPLETIGPRESRRLAIGHVDPINENWLEAPMDFQNEVFASELRRALMARASVEENDLVPNPMPALRSVEMFSVG